MGLTTQDVTSGTASPSLTLAQPVNPPTITVGGVAVTNILFSGLTPTLVGLYQVDFQVPAAVPNGDLPLVLTQSDGSATRRFFLFTTRKRFDHALKTVWPPMDADLRR